MANQIFARLENRPDALAVLADPAALKQAVKQYAASRGGDRRHQLYQSVLQCARTVCQNETIAGTVATSLCTGKTEANLEGMLATLPVLQQSIVEAYKSEISGGLRAKIIGVSNEQKGLVHFNKIMELPFEELRVLVADDVKLKSKIASYDRLESSIKTQAWVPTNVMMHGNQHTSMMAMPPPAGQFSVTACRTTWRTNDTAPYPANGDAAETGTAAKFSSNAAGGARKCPWTWSSTFFIGTTATTAWATGERQATYCPAGNVQSAPKHAADGAWPKTLVNACSGPPSGAVGMNPRGPMMGYPQYGAQGSYNSMMMHGGNGPVGGARAPPAKTASAPAAPKRNLMKEALLAKLAQEKAEAEKAGMGNEGKKKASEKKVVASTAQPVGRSTSSAAVGEKKKETKAPVVKEKAAKDAPKAATPKVNFMAEVLANLKKDDIKSGGDGTKWEKKMEDGKKEKAEKAAAAKKAATEVAKTGVAKSSDSNVDDLVAGMKTMRFDNSSQKSQKGIQKPEQAPKIDGNGNSTLQNKPNRSSMQRAPAISATNRSFNKG